MNKLGSREVAALKAKIAQFWARHDAEVARHIVDTNAAFMDACMAWALTDFVEKYTGEK